MQLNEMIFNGPQPIDGYGPGFFRVGGTVRNGPILIRAEAVRDWDGSADAAIAAMQGEIDVLLLGMGADIANAPDGFIEALEAAGIGVDIMSSPSACRTYNVLLSEGRRVGVAVFPVTL